MCGSFLGKVADVDQFHNLVNCESEGSDRNPTPGWDNDVRDMSVSTKVHIAYDQVFAYLAPSRGLCMRSGRVSETRSVYANPTMCGEL